MIEFCDLKIMIMLRSFVGISLVLGTLSAAVGESTSLQGQMLQGFHGNHIVANRRGKPPPTEEDLAALLIGLADVESPFGVDKPLPVVGEVHRITAFKRNSKPAEISIPGAKHLTLWYNGPEFPKQLNQKVLENDSFYQSLKIDPEKMDSVVGTYWSGRMVDFPGNITIYSARLSLEDKNGNMINITNGVYLTGVGAIQATIEITPLQDCPDMLRGFPLGLGILPHALVDALNDGTSLFTAADGSQPKTGVWSKDLAEMVLVVGGISLDSEKAIPTTLRLDIDYAEGKPEVRTLRKELGLGDMCGKGMMEKINGGGKTWISKSKLIKYALPDVDIYSIRGDIHDGGTEMKIKVNGKEVCTSKAEYIKIPPNPRTLKVKPTPSNSIVKMTDCNTPWKLLKGDEIELESYYDFDKYPIPESMEKYIISNNQFPPGMMEKALFTITRRPRVEKLTNVPEWMIDLTGV